MAQVDTKPSPFAVIRTVLDNFYRLGGAISALFLIAILTLILIQMIARWTGEVFPGAPDYVVRVLKEHMTGVKLLKTTFNRQSFTELYNNRKSGRQEA